MRKVLTHQLGLLGVGVLTLLAACTADQITQPMVDDASSAPRYTHLGDPCVNVILTTQGEVDAFDCTVVTGYLRVGGTGITDVDGLSALTSVGSLIIQSNAALTNVDGLSGVTSVGAGLTISFNAALTNVDGLSALTSVGALHVSSNAALTNVDGLSGVTSVLNLYIDLNPALTNVDGLSGITSVAALDINSNAALTNVDGLSGVTSLSAFLNIGGNAALTNVDGLSGVTSVRDLSIEGNAALTNVDGLSALTTVGSRLHIRFNAALTNVDGLAGLTSVGLSGGFSPGLRLTTNPVLADCSGVYYLLLNGGVIGITEIANNAPGCDSVAEITPPATTPEEQIDALGDAVQDLLSGGTLNGSEAGALTASLDAALSSLAAGNTNAGTNQLGAFIRKVNALIRSRRLTGAEGQALIAFAQAAIDGINGA